MERRWRILPAVGARAASEMEWRRISGGGGVRDCRVRVRLWGWKSDGAPVASDVLLVLCLDVNETMESGRAERRTKNQPYEKDNVQYQG